MRTVAHLSDLHFGRTDPRMVERLQDALRDLRPDLVVVSGDLTQRAKTAEFLEARAFLDAIPKPQVVVPGNHDIALYNLYGRFVERLDKYRHYIGDVEPSYIDEELVVISVNTARSLTFKGGRINARQVERVRVAFAAFPDRLLKILVAHHPLDLPATLEHPLVGRARMALRALAKCGIDVVLSGHLHIAGFSAAERFRVGGHTALLVQAGTAVSTRSRGEVNSFNVIRADGDRLDVEQRCWSVESGDFTECKLARYHYSEVGWIVPQPRDS